MATRQALYFYHFLETISTKTVYGIVQWIIKKLLWALFFLCVRSRAKLLYESFKTLNKPKHARLIQVKASLISTGLTHFRLDYYKLLECSVKKHLISVSFSRHFIAKTVLAKQINQGVSTWYALPKEGDIGVYGNAVSVYFRNCSPKSSDCGMIKPYGKRFSYVLVHGIRCRNYATELSDLRLFQGGRNWKLCNLQSLVRDHALQARFILTIVCCCTDKGYPRAQSNMGKKM